MTVESILQKSKMYEVSMAHALLSRMISDFHQSTLKRYGLTTIEWLVMGAIADTTPNGGIRVTDLASFFDVKSTYISSVLNDLRTKGYIENRFDASDARVRKANATKKALKEIAVIDEYIRQQATRELEGVITPQELDAYVSIITKIVKARLPHDTTATHA